MTPALSSAYGMSGRRHERPLGRLMPMRRRSSMASARKIEEADSRARFHPLTSAD